MTDVMDAPTDSLSSTDYLRSVNVIYDMEAPEHIAHYRPTAKTIPLMRSLVIDRTPGNYLVVAPYGSGKSLLATFAALAIENTGGATGSLRGIVDRLRSVAPEVHEHLADRIDKQQIVRPSGVAVVLHGYEPNLADALLTALRRAFGRLGIDIDLPFDDTEPPEALPDVLRWLSDAKDQIRRSAANVNLDVQRIVLLWDEFGRHLEELVSDGDAARLDDVQLLAEFAARQRALPFSLSLFLHQSLANYAAGLSQTVRREWKKVEGRFETIQFVDDSAEITSLISDIVASLRPDAARSNDVVSPVMPALGEVGLFRDIPASSLPGILQKAYPLEPVTLYLLPRVSARVAQNERTLFTFLVSADLREPITPGHLFDYFAESMRSDTGVGGAYHQWLETQNALEKAPDEESAEALKAAGLLSLGIAGQRSRISKALLEQAVCGYRQQEKLARATIENLIDKRLLLYRKSTDQVAVWHGVDVDLRGRLEHEKTRVGLSFDLIDFLSREMPAHPWLPVEYNSDYAMTRFFAAAYVRASDLRGTAEVLDGRLDAEADGYMLHVIPDDADEIEALPADLRTAPLSGRIVVSVPRRRVQIYDAALEVYTLRRMQDDDALTGEDPLVLPELQQMTDDALEYLRRALMRAVEPSPDGPLWFIGDETSEVDTPAELRRVLSSVCRDEFPNTPCINNELIVRRRPRQVIVNARKKLVSAILEHYGEEHLSIEGFRPDRSMFNTVLLHTGLYRQVGSTWRFSLPDELPDDDLKTVWKWLHDFLTKPSRRPKNLSTLLTKLSLPPVGLRAGVYPILLAAALRAFPSALSITEKGAYVTDILPSTVEAMCSRPADFGITVLPMDSDVKQLLERLRECFDRQASRSVETDLVRVTFDAVQRWLAALPPAALTTRRVSKEAARLRTLLSRITDPVDLFLTRLPEAFGFDGLSDASGIERMKTAVQELEDVLSVYYVSATATLQEALQLRATAQLAEQVREWTQLIPTEAFESMSNTLARALYTRFAMDYDTPERLIDSVASLLVDKTVNRWDDSTMISFDMALRSTVSQIEEYALLAAKDKPELGSNLVKLAEVRIRNLYRYVEQIVGPAEAAGLLRRVAKQEQEV